jgi:hypothetical protein
MVAPHPVSVDRKRADVVAVLGAVDCYAVELHFIKCIEVVGHTSFEGDRDVALIGRLGVGEYARRGCSYFGGICGIAEQERQ